MIFLNINYHYNVSDDILSYDEGDYFQAAKKGFFVNWYDADDISISEFVQMGIEAFRGTKSVQQLSDEFRKDDITIFLRHNHSPVALYPFFIVESLKLGLPIEKQMRLTNLIWVYIWLIIILILFLKFPQISSPWFILIPISSNLSISMSYFNMHIPFGLMSSLGFYCWYYYEKEPNEKWFRILAIFFISTAIVCVEYSLFLLGALILWCAQYLLFSSERKKFLKSCFMNLVIGFSFIIILWPASIFKLNLLKSYSHQIYMSIFRISKLETSPFNSFWNMIFWKWSPSIFELIILIFIFSVVVFLIVKKNKSSSLFVSFILLSIIMFLQLNPNLTLRWYLFPVFIIAYFVLVPIILSEVTELKLQQKTNQMLFLLCFSLVIFFNLASSREKEYSETKEIKIKISEVNYSNIILPRSLFPQLRNYINGNVIDYHDKLFENKFFLDSLGQNYKNYLLVLPIKCDRGDKGRLVLKTNSYSLVHIL